MSVEITFLYSFQKYVKTINIQFSLQWSLFDKVIKVFLARYNLFYDGQSLNVFEFVDRISWWLLDHLFHCVVVYAHDQTNCFALHEAVGL